MAEAYYNGKSLMRSGVFKTQAQMVEYLLLRVLHERNEPVGSWALKSSLDAYGVELSTATVGRHLKKLEDREFTVQVSNLGRVLTPLGAAHFSSLHTRVNRAKIRDMTSEALKVNEYDELLDLLCVRVALETQTARQAAQRAGKKDIAKLDAALERHRECIRENRDPTDTALEFHSVVAHISHNKFAAALLDMLIYEEKEIEAVFQTLVTRERGKTYVVDHDEITQAIRERNPDEAARLMHEHVMELYYAVKDQADEFKV